MSHEIKDSGKRRQYETGAQRDRGDVKPRPGLIHPYCTARFGLHLAKGADKYDSWNWYKGMPLSDWFDSLKRHVEDLGMGLQDEDHCSAIMFNVMGYMITELGLKTGRYPKELDDMQDHSDMFEAYLALKEEAKLLTTRNGHVEEVLTTSEDEEQFNTISTTSFGTKE